MLSSTVSAPSKGLTPKEFGLFRDLIYREAGISLSPAKHQLVESRLVKRLRTLGFASFTEYYEFVTSGDPSGEERLKLINCLTTNKTDFFRERHHFEFLQKTLFPAIEQRANETGERRLRLWSAACSTGEEPYTLAMTVLDYFGPMSVNGWDIRILASDVDTEVLSRASAGRYEADRLGDVPADIRKKYFVRTSRAADADYQVRPELQEMITFRRINFVDAAWPIQTNFDLIFCRNVMIYFDEVTQDRLLTRFSEVLVPEGHLFIGHSESILRLDNLYRSLGDTIYRLRPGMGAAARRASTGTKIAPSAVLPSVGTNAARTTAGSTTATSASSPTTTQESKVAWQDEMGLPAQSLIVGELRASAEPARLTTLVGSCITVCLHDPVARIGGMNHFMLPDSAAGGRETATYGIHAMELLINQLMKLGANRRRLEAKVFGGANVLGRPLPSGSMLNIGERNARFAIEFLETENIPVRAQSIGGTRGRQVHFLTHTGQAFVRETKNTRIPDHDDSQVARVQIPQGTVELFVDPATPTGSRLTSENSNGSQD
ncbi:MAG: CheR family methyltransferase [Planctomycetaceae bacterium]